MILFRCWFCNRAFTRPDEEVGIRFLCKCGRHARVPRRSGGSSKAWTLTDWLIETVVYGGCGAVVGFGLGVLMVGEFPAFRRSFEILGGMTLAGLLVGVLFGEAGLNWIGRQLRDRENR
jgi:hypothetical protein